jgi:hypothetical protein
MIKKILPVLLGLVIAGAAVGYYLYNKPVASLERKKADVATTSVDLLNAYVNDEAAANTTYLGKVVEVTGPVSLVTDEGGKIKVYLDTGNPMSAVICELAEGPMPDLKTGETATLKGLCSGYLSDVVIVQSHLIKP